MYREHNPWMPAVTVDAERATYVARAVRRGATRRVPDGMYVAFDMAAEAAKDYAKWLNDCESSHPAPDREGSDGR